MTTRAELEQENEILSAENEQLNRDLLAARAEIDRVRGDAAKVREAATAAGVALTITTTTPEEEERTELARVRDAISDDLQALQELRNPPPLPGPAPESAIEIVRANQREKAELHDRLNAANLTVNRIAAILGLERVDGEAIVARIQALSTLKAEVGARLKRARRDAKAAQQSRDDHQRGIMDGEDGALQWVLSKLAAIEDKAHRDALGADAPGKVPGRFRKKPVVIHARQWDGHPSSLVSMIVWAKDLPNVTTPLPFSVKDGAGDERVFMVVETLEGTHLANPGDWIICGVKGEFYPCKPDIFAATYEVA